MALDSSARAACGCALALASTGCMSLAPVARDPWVEDRSLELGHERLALVVHGDAVDVDARFDFTPRSGPRAHGMLFAVGGAGGPARSFRAELVAANGAVTPLAVQTGGALPLPIDDVGETWSFRTPSDAFVAPGSWLRVRYTQHVTRRFDYVLRSGAYWAGPIGALEVVLADPEQRVASASVERRGPDVASAGRLTWRFAELEPRDTIQLRFR